MSTLKEALEQLTAWVKQHHPNLAASKRPGLTPDEIDSQSQNLPFQLSQEIRELYQWSNECNIFRSPYYFDEMLNFVPLQTAVRYSQSSEAGYLSTQLNIPGFFMFSEFERWVHFAVCDEETISPILVVTDDPYTRIAYTSITSMVLTSLECYEKGVFHVGKYGYFVLNKSLANEFKAIREKHNLMFNEETIRQKYNISNCL
jgi:hypothetical protein